MCIGELQGAGKWLRWPGMWRLFLEVFWIGYMNSKESVTGVLCNWSATKKLGTWPAAVILFLDSMCISWTISVATRATHSLKRLHLRLWNFPRSPSRPLRYEVQFCPCKVYKCRSGSTSIGCHLHFGNLGNSEGKRGQFHATDVLVEERLFCLSLTPSLSLSLRSEKSVSVL